MTSKLRSEPSGCNITKEDTPIVIASITCCLAYGTYGACYSCLSAALPQLADHLNKEDADFGIGYTTRGIGYLVGTLFSAFSLNLPTFQTSKTFCASIAIVISGVTTLAVSLTVNFPFILALFFLQGVGFGGVDMMANCAIPEMWELRAQPWMQALLSCFGTGLILGPLLVGALGYRISFVVVAVMSAAPLGILFLGYINNKRQKLFQNSNNNNRLNSFDSVRSSADSRVVNNILQSHASPPHNTQQNVHQNGTEYHVENGTKHPSFTSQYSNTNRHISFSSTTEDRHSFQTRLANNHPSFSSNGNTDSFHVMGEIVNILNEPHEKQLLRARANTASSNKSNSRSNSRNVSVDKHSSEVSGGVTNTINIANTPLKIHNTINTTNNIIAVPSNPLHNTANGANTDSLTSTNNTNTNHANINLIEAESEPKVHKIPTSVRYLTCVFYFIYMGIVSGFAAWLPTYALDSGVTNTFSQAANVLSIYSGALTFGRLLAIFLTMRYTATVLLRIQLFLLVSCSVVLVMIGSVNYLDLCIASALLGFAISSVFGLAMTVLTDYGHTLDSATTTSFMVGTTIGDAVLPVMIGFAMQYAGSHALLYLMLGFSSVMAFLYIAIHSLSVMRMKEKENGSGLSEALVNVAAE